MITSGPGYFVNRRPSTVTASPHSINDNDFLTASSKSSAWMVLLSRIFPSFPMITRSQGYSPCDNEVFPLPLRGRDCDNDVQLVVLIPRILLDILAPDVGGWGTSILYQIIGTLARALTLKRYIYAPTLRLFAALFCSPIKLPYSAALFSSPTLQP